MLERSQASVIKSWAWPDKWVAGTVGLMTAVILIILQPSHLLHDGSTGWTAEPAQNKLFADFDSQIALIGFDRSQEEVQPGDTINVHLYWKAQQPLNINYQSFLHVLKTDGTLLTQSDHLNPGDYPTRRWPLDKYVRDEFVLAIPEDALPGNYTVSAGLWVQTEGWRLPLLDANGNQVDDKAALFTLTVVTE
jgi:hypothetical protein